MNKMVKINDKHTLSKTSPVYIIAEMSANHNNDINTAKEIMYAAKQAGADCIKLQTYSAETITLKSNKDHFKISGGLWDGYTLFDLYKEASTPWEWFKELKELADDIGIDFLSTPFDETAVDLLEEIGVDFYKIASFELIHTPLVEYIASKKKPIIMSTGMSTLEEIDHAVNAIKQYHDDIVILRCVSAYPASFEDMHLSNLDDMRERYQSIVGLSDHSIDNLSVIAAVAKGAKVIEKHFCLDKSIKTADVEFSLDPTEFKEMVTIVRNTEKALGNVSYGPSASEKSNLVFRRSVFVCEDIKKGEMFTEENIKVLRPGYGIAPMHYKETIGKKAEKDLEKGEPLKWEDINDK